MNVNEFGELKGYKLRHSFVSLPDLKILPVNSPFNRVWRYIVNVFVEAGFETHWMQTDSYSGAMGFKHFNEIVQFDKYHPLQLNEVWCVFILHGVLLALAFCVFLLEIVVFHHKNKKARQEHAREIRPLRVD